MQRIGHPLLVVKRALNRQGGAVILVGLVVIVMLPGHATQREVDARHGVLIRVRAELLPAGQTLLQIALGGCIIFLIPRQHASCAVDFGLQCGRDSGLLRQRLLQPAPPFGQIAPFQPERAGRNRQTRQQFVLVSLPLRPGKGGTQVVEIRGNLIKPVALFGQLGHRRGLLNTAQIIVRMRGLQGS